MLSEITAFKVALESVKGTEVAGTQAVYAEDLVIKSTGEFIQRKGSGIYLGNTEPGVIGGEHGEVTFTTELRGTGSVGLELGLAMLLQACGYKQTAQVYNAHSAFTDQKTISIDVYENGILKTLYGAAGTYTMDAKAGGRILFKFTFTGLYKEDEDVGVPAYAPSTRAPIMWGGGSFSYGGVSQMISKLSFDAGNIVAPKYDVAGPGGIAYYFVSTYDPAVSWDPEAKLVATDPVHANWKAGVEGAMALAMVDADDTVTLDMIKVQYKDIPPGTRDNLRIYEATGQCRHSAGNDSVIFTVTAT